MIEYYYQSYCHSKLLNFSKSLPPAEALHVKFHALITRPLIYLRRQHNEGKVQIIPSMDLKPSISLPAISNSFKLVKLFNSARVQQYIYTINIGKGLKHLVLFEIEKEESQAHLQYKLFLLTYCSLDIMILKMKGHLKMIGYCCWIC